MRVPKPAARMTAATCDCALPVSSEFTAARRLTMQGGTVPPRRLNPVGGPGFEPGTKAPKALVIPFHHPPTAASARLMVPACNAPCQGSPRAGGPRGEDSRGGCTDWGESSTDQGRALLTR